MTVTQNPARNRQAKNTVGILNTVRYVGTGLFLLMAALSALAAVIGIVQSGGAYFSFGGFLVALIFTLWAAVVYAVVGWFVDSLALLVKIEENTRR